MAITWGDSRTGGNNGIRLGYEFSQSPAVVASSTDSVTVTLKIYVWTMGPISDSNNNLGVAGDFSSTGSVSVSTSAGGSWSTSNQQLIKTLTRTVSTSFTSGVTSSFAADLDGIEAIGAGLKASVSGSWTTAKRPPFNPDAPTAAVLTRQSDAQHTFAWTRTNPNDSTKPYTRQVVQRADLFVSSDYSTIATISGSVSSYVDKSTAANKKYSYRVRAENDGGVSAWLYSPTFYTTPGAPTSPIAKKVSGDIQVNWSRYAHVEAKYEAEDWADGVAQAPTKTTAANASSVTFAAPDPLKSHAYRVRSYVDDVTFGKLASAWTPLSSEVSILAAPNAPTGLIPDGVAADGALPIALKWTHNPTDTTAQTAYSLQHRAVGSSTWTTIAKTASTASSHTLAAGTYANGSQFEWQVQTWGEHTSGSAWSSSAIVSLSGTPTATSNVPTTVNGSSLTATWSYYDPEGTAQSAYRVSLEQGGAVVEQKTGTGSSNTWEPSTRLTDGGTYTFRVAVRDGDGLWSEDSVTTFTVSYASPPKGTLTAVYDLQSGGAVLEATVPNPSAGEVDAVTWRIERHTGRGDWVAVTSEMAVSAGSSQSVSDPLPAVNALNRYRVVTTSALPSTAVSNDVILDTTKHRGFVYVNAGPGFSQVIRFADNATASVSAQRDRAFNQFAGRSYPVATAGESRSKTVNVSGRLGANSATADEVEYLLDTAGVFCVRAPYMERGAGGNIREFVQPDGAVSLDFEKTKGSLSLTFRKVDFVE